MNLTKKIKTSLHETHESLNETFQWSHVFFDQKRVNVCEHTLNTVPSESFGKMPLEAVRDPSKTLMWHHVYRVFTYIYSLLIEKDTCDHQNISFKLPCVYVCLLSRDLFILLVKVPSFFSYFLCYPYFGTFLSTWCPKNINLIPY